MTFNLSEKIGQGCEPYRLSISDVKEFIKHLKEEFKPFNKENFKCEYIEKAIPRIIDKLAGDKLT